MHAELRRFTGGCVYLFGSDQPGAWERREPFVKAYSVEDLAPGRIEIHGVTRADPDHPPLTHEEMIALYRCLGDEHGLIVKVEQHGVVKWLGTRRASRGRLSG